MADKTRPGGYLIVSLWRFMDDENLARKAQVAHERALKRLGSMQLEDGGFILGWKDNTDAYRYCHSFDDVEIDTLVSSLESRAVPVCRFSSDGRNGSLNSYLIMKVI